MPLFDVLSTLMGRPDPSMQLAAALGQGPGQPGGGPPVAGAAAPPVGQATGAAPAGQGGPQGQQGAPQGGTPAATMPNGQQAPQAFQSPSDLSQMYLAMVQRAQAERGFNSGLALLAASAYPGRTPGGAAGIANAMNAGVQDPSTTFGNLMQLQMYGQEMQNRQAMRAAIPDMLEKAGIDQKFAPIVMANPDILSKILETQAGVGGGPAWMAQKRAEAALTAAGKQIPWTPGDPTSYDAWTKTNTASEEAKKKEVDATQGNFQPAVQAYDQQLKNVDELLDPKNRDALGELTGWYSATIKPTAALSDEAQRLKKVYDTVMAGQFSSAVQDFPGSRISTKELVADAPSKSTMGLVQSTPDLVKATQDYRQQIVQHRANLFGKAQQLGSADLSDADYAQVNPIYKDGGDLAPKSAINRQGPDTSVKTEADIAKLPHGRAFVIPDGTGRIGYAP